MNPTSLLHWWPVTKDLGIPVPKTEIITLAEPIEAESLLYACSVHGFGDDDCNPDSRADDACTTLLTTYEPQVLEALAKLGLPLFLRTDLISGKHGWDDTCFVGASLSSIEEMRKLTPIQHVMRHVWAVVEAHALALMFAGPDDYVHALVFREFLDLDAPFKSFKGMPVARERRYFVEDGAVVCHHPYWEDADNIEHGFEYPGNDGHPPNWRKQLESLNLESVRELDLLHGYARRVAEVLPGAWSVDFAHAKDGTWYLIDMAVAEQSWHPEHSS